MPPEIHNKEDQIFAFLCAWLNRVSDVRDPFESMDRMP
jgi:hypothetical protein